MNWGFANLTTYFRILGVAESPASDEPSPSGNHKN